MKKDDLVFVGHMLETARKAMDLVRSKTRTDYDEDEVLRIALTHLIQVIGEAASRVSPEFRKQYPEIPWPRIVGMRHRVVHDYIHVDYDIVWETVSSAVPPLAETLEKIVPPEPQ